MPKLEASKERTVLVIEIKRFEYDQIAKRHSDKGSKIEEALLNHICESLEFEPNLPMPLDSRQTEIIPVPVRVNTDIFIYLDCCNSGQIPRSRYYGKLIEGLIVHSQQIAEHGFV